MRTRFRIKAESNSSNIDKCHIQTLSSPSTEVTKPTTQHLDNGNISVTSHVKEEPTIVPSQNAFEFQGVYHTSYEEMVKAKRKRNAQVLIDSGLLNISARFRDDASTKGSSKSGASQRGLSRADTNRKRKDIFQESLPRRKSGRIAGDKADGLYIADDVGGKFIVGVEGGVNKSLEGNDKINGHTIVDNKVDDQYRNRINNGDDLTLKQAVEETGLKWVKEESVSDAEHFVRNTITSTIQSTNSMDKVSASSIHSQISSLSLDCDTSVAKVVPERIYAVAFHPSPHKIIAVAGDKRGHIGFWDVDATSTHGANDGASSIGSKGKVDGVHLFKPHAGTVANLEFNKDGTKLYSVSYDSTVRMFDMQKQTFSEIFAAYDSSPEYNGKLGFGIDMGYKFWTQYGCLDHRNDDSMFLTTSMGSLLHVDFRKKRITMNQKVSEKKVNTVSLHPNGTTIATCGLDRQVQLWDIRKFSARTASSKPFATQMSTKSINSAFFSPTGKHLLNTNMSDSLDIITDAHLKTKLISKPTHRIRHDNRTGRWLSTLMARWHPTAHEVEDELFVVGSMRQPRTMELFNGSKGVLLRGIQGDALTAVVSRCCFHPSLGSLVVMGGNSSGRVSVAR